MNGKDLLNKMSDVDPKLIEDADKKPRRSRKWFVGITTGAAATAAAALIAVTIGYNVAQDPPVIDTSDPANSGLAASSDIVNSGNTSTQDPPVVDLTPKDPPKLDFSKYKDLPKISSEKTDVTGWGIKGSHIAGEKSSPWKGAVLETMPVYMSSATDLDLEDMYKYMRSVAAAFGISEEELEITETGYPDETNESYRKIMEEQGVPEEEIIRELERTRRISMQDTEVTGKAEGIEFHLRANYSIEIIFTTPVELPEKYNFSQDASPEEQEKVMRYLTEKYSKALGYNKPTLKDESETFKAVYKVYDADGDLEQQIVNYWLNNTSFTEDSDEAGKLKSIVVRSLAGCEKIGDYPILTAEQAEAILKSTKYNDANRMPLDANILKVDLVYDNSYGSTGIIPYYEFLIDTDEESDHRGFYTIPAVPEEFIDMETDDYGVYA